MATRYGRTRHRDTVWGTDENDYLYGWDWFDPEAADFMSDTLYGGGGDDVLYGGGGNDFLYGEADDDTLYGGWGGDLLDGGEGIDTAVYIRSPQPVYLSLLAGTGSLGEADGDTFVSIENVIGSWHDDVIIGNDVRNVIEGGWGADRIYGEGGDDWLYGEAGNDRLYGGDGRDHLFGGADVDTLFGGGDGDWLYGGAGNDFLYGGAGPDVFNGDEGADLFSGGDDGYFDYADYQGSAARVIVNLQTGRGSGGFAEGDRYESIENVRGSWFDDVITGDDANNTLYGGQGRDGISGGGGDDEIHGEEGADKLDGGSHVSGDTVNYHSSNAGVYINLRENIARYGHAEGDTITGFEHVKGSRYDDNLRGDNGNNNLDGNWGDDDLYGYAGADNLTGGRGLDTFHFTSVSDSTPSAPDWIHDLTPYDIIDLSAIDANPATAIDDPFTLIDAPGFSAAGQLRIEDHGREGWVVLGETTGDRVADFTISIANPWGMDPYGAPLMTAADIHFDL